MIMAENKDDVLFLQKLDDLAQKSLLRYSPGFTHFLDGRQLSVAERYLKRYSQDLMCIKFGGFKDAERNVLGLFPKAVYDYTETEELLSMFEIKAVQIKGSGFGKFSHRDVLGSVLSLGIKRETVGEIFVSDSMMEAIVVLDKVACDYIVLNLDFVARDKVKICEINVLDLPVIEKRYSVINGTVASERLDCVIAMICGISREKAKSVICTGLVNVNHFEELRCDFQVSEGDILSVRGFGRFVIHEFSGVTRKGRDKIVIHKMI